MCKDADAILVDWDAIWLNPGGVDSVRGSLLLDKNCLPLDSPPQDKFNFGEFWVSCDNEIPHQTSCVSNYFAGDEVATWSVIGEFSGGFKKDGDNCQRVRVFCIFIFALKCGAARDLESLQRGEEGCKNARCGEGYLSFFCQTIGRASISLQTGDVSQREPKKLEFTRWKSTESCFQRQGTRRILSPFCILCSLT
jgi:hypothetical protein